MGELDDALKLAHIILDRRSADPNDDLAVLARQLIRAREVVPVDTSVLQDDLRQFCELLDLPSGARPQSPHEVFQECLIALRERLGWRDTATAPRDGTKITGLYEEGEDTIYWSEQRYCVIGAPQGSFGAGWLSVEADNLPADPPQAWKPRQTPTQRGG